MTMSQPMSHPDLRRRNLSLLLGTLLNHQETTRKLAEGESGLSKATVSRLTDELLQAGAVVSRTSVPSDPSTRGRRAETLSTSAALGMVAGLSLGTRTTSIFVTDLTGRQLSWQQVQTPTWASFDDALSWVSDFILHTIESFPAPLRRIVVSVPSRPINGVRITRSPLFMSVIEGSDFARELAKRLECPVRMELDAAMVLVGIEILGFIDSTNSPVLLNASSVLTMSLRRRDGTIADGMTASFGNFDLIPIETSIGPTSIGTLLGARGLFEISERLGHPLDDMADLWELDTEVIERLRDAFQIALIHAIRIITVMTDPRLIIFTGRLSPLVRRCLPHVDAALSAELADPPELQVIGHASNDYPSTVGAAHEARGAAVIELLDRVSRVGLDALK